MKSYLAAFVEIESLIRALSGLHAIVVGFMTLCLATGLAFGEGIAAFQVSSILTTTGYATKYFARWLAHFQAVLLVTMFIGGCAGSTGGGVKVMRIVTMLKLDQSEMRYLLNPRGVYGLFMDGRYLRKNAIYDFTAMVFRYFVSAFVSMLVVASGGYDIVNKPHGEDGQPG